METLKFAYVMFCIDTLKDMFSGVVFFVGFVSFTRI